MIYLQVLTNKKQNTRMVYQDLRPIQTYPDIIKHIQVYSGSIQAYSETQCNPGIMRNLVYSEAWHIPSRHRNLSKRCFNISFYVV